MSLANLIGTEIDPENWDLTDDDDSVVTRDFDLPTMLWPQDPITSRWAQALTSSRVTGLRATEWYIECALLGTRTLEDSIEVDIGRRGGVPVLKGTGFTVAQTLAELAQSTGVTEVAENFDLDTNTIRKMLNGLSLLLDKPYIR